MALRLADRAARADVEGRYNEMLKEATMNGWKPNCHRPGAIREFADYTRVPTEEQAAALCAGCPMLELCREYAETIKPHATVMAGVAWDRGRPAVRPVPKEKLVAISS